MIVNFEDQEYTLDIEEVDVRQATLIKVKTGLNLLEWQASLETGDVDALRALYWLMREQSNKPVNFESINFKIIKFANAIAEASGDAESEENPTTTA
jgi:hypothetical protein